MNSRTEAKIRVQIQSNTVYKLGVVQAGLQIEKFLFVASWNSWSPLQYKFDTSTSLILMSETRGCCCLLFSTVKFHTFLLYITFPHGTHRRHFSPTPYFIPYLPLRLETRHHCTSKKTARSVMGSPALPGRPVITLATIQWCVLPRFSWSASEARLSPVLTSRALWVSTRRRRSGSEWITCRKGTGNAS